MNMFYFLQTKNCKQLNSSYFEIYWLKTTDKHNRVETIVGAGRERALLTSI